MTYRELLELYKSGKLDENRKNEIEAEIEKQDAISEYLFEESKIPGIDDLGDTESTAETEADEKFISYVQKSIRKAFIKAGTVMGAIVLAIVLFVIFVLPDFVSLFYYSPAKIIEEEYSINQITLDMAVYTDMFMPGNYRDAVIAEDLGYGKYRIKIWQHQSIDGNFDDVDGIIERNKLILYDSASLRLPNFNIFVPERAIMGSVATDGDTGERIGLNGTRKEADKAIEELDESKYYKVYVTLKDMMEYEDFYKWFIGCEISDYYLWCAVGACDETGMIISPNMGFNVMPGGTCFRWDKEKYPYLSLTDLDGGIVKDSGNGEIMKTHFISMLSYLRDNDDIVKMMNTGEVDFDSIIESVKKDGLNIYGFFVVAQKEDILKLREQPEVTYIGTEDL